MPTLTSVVEIVVKGTVTTTGAGAKNFANIFHYRKTTGGANQTPAAVCNQFLTDVWAVVAPLLSDQYIGSESMARYLDDALEQYSPGNVPDSGAVTGDRLPTDMAAVYLLRTGTRGKSFRGSKHFGPIAESATTGDQLSTAAVTAWAAVTTALADSITVGTETYVPVIVSRTLSQLRTNPTTIIGADVTAALLNKTIGTMRRRREATVR